MYSVYSRHMQIGLCKMVIECCPQERSYSTFYGLIGERFCRLNRVWFDCFEQAFREYYETIHRYETNRLRNIARFFGHLLASDAVSWNVFDCIQLTEEDTTSSSRIFIKILFQEITESMGLKVVAERFKDPEVRMSCRGMFPMDNPKDTRFAINYFTSINLGPITEEMREHLKVRPFHSFTSSTSALIMPSVTQNAPRIIMEQRRAMLEAESSSSDSDSSDSDSSDTDTKSSSDSDSDSDSERDSDESRNISPRPNDDAREMPSSGAVWNSNVPDAKAKTARPGEGYAVYSADDVLGRLPEAYAAVLGRAAGWCGVTGDELGTVVERFERRLGRLFARQRRRERERDREKERE